MQAPSRIAAPRVGAHDSVISPFGKDYAHDFSSSGGAKNALHSLASLGSGPLGGPHSSFSQKGALGSSGSLGRGSGVMQRASSAGTCRTPCMQGTTETWIAQARMIGGNLKRCVENRVGCDLVATQMLAYASEIATVGTGCIFSSRLWGNHTQQISLLDTCGMVTPSQLQSCHYSLATDPARAFGLASILE